MLVDSQQSCAALEAVLLYQVHQELESCHFFYNCIVYIDIVVICIIITSGAIYSTVPTGLMATSCFMLMVSPKSPSFTRPSLPMKMFSSLISLHLHSFFSLLQ